MILYDFEIIKMYYHTKLLCEDLSKSDEIKSIAEKVLDLPLIDDSINNNLKGLIMLMAGQYLEESFYIDFASDCFMDAINYYSPEILGLDYNEILLNLANSYNMIGKAEEAAQIFHDLIRDENPIFRALANISYSYTCYLLSDFQSGISAADEGISFFESEVNKKPNGGYLCHGLNNKALNLYGMGNKRDSDLLFKKLSEICPKFSDAAKNLKNSQSNRILEKLNSGIIEESEVSLLFEKLDPDIVSTHLYNSAYEFYKKNDFVKSERILELLLAENPEFSAAIILKSLISWKEYSKPDYGIVHMNNIAIDDKYYNSAQNLLGCIYYNSGDTEEAEQCFIKATRSQNQNEIKALFWQNLSICYYENGKIELGDNAQEKAKQLME